METLDENATMTESTEIECDVVVVGAGGSGLATALSAVQNGCSVVVLEKAEACGGTTGLAVGSITAAGTNLQKRAGIQDSAEDHIEDAAGFAPPEIEARNNAELRAFHLRHAGEAWNWLQKLGLPFQGPMPEPPNRQPRMHNVVPNAKAYIDGFLRHLRNQRCEIRCGCKVVELLMEGSRVAGVRAESAEGDLIVKAARGVVLAAGDYAAANDLIERFKGAEYSGMRYVNPEATGDGQRLVESVGGDLVNMDVTYGPELRFDPAEGGLLDKLPSSGPIGWLLKKSLPLVPKPVLSWVAKRRIVSWQHPEDAIFKQGGIMVNARGERFCNEAKGGGELERGLARQPDAAGWILFDRRLQEAFSEWPNFVSTAPKIAYAYVDDYRSLRPDLCIEGKTLEELARNAGMDAERLSEAVARRNRALSAGSGDDFGAEPLGEQLEGPWLLLGPAYPYLTITEGGANVDEKMRVRRKDGSPIEGLFAVGQNGNGGQILFGHGLHIGWAITSGYLLGKHLGNTSGPEDGAKC